MIESFLNDFIDVCQYIELPEDFHRNYFTIQWHNYRQTKNKCICWQKFHLLWLFAFALNTQTSPTHSWSSSHVWWFIHKLIKRKIWPETENSGERNKNSEQTSRERGGGIYETTVNFPFPQWWFSAFAIFFFVFLLDYRIKFSASLGFLFKACQRNDLWISIRNLWSVSTVWECQLFFTLIAIFDKLSAQYEIVWVIESTT